jgi:GNAT superfamily N-acetyltransferase
MHIVLGARKSGERAGRRNAVRASAHVEHGLVRTLGRAPRAPGAFQPVTPIDPALLERRWSYTATDELMLPRATINLPLNAAEVPALRARVGLSRREHDYPVLLERCQFWAAARDAEGTLVAFGYLSGMGLEHGYIEDVMVDPAYRRQGLGRALVLALLEEATRRGTAIVTVTFAPAHRAFYEACGFEIGYGGVWAGARTGTRTNGDP